MSVNSFKNLIPMSVIYNLKYLKQFKCKEMIRAKSEKNKIYFLDAPSYANLGDQAIAYAIRGFACENFPDYEFVEILQEEFPKYYKYLKKNIKNTDMIFMIGGGNMGNVYHIYEAARRFVIKNFLDIPIIIFPQTIDYSDNILGKLSALTARKIYGKNDNLLVTAREKYSYDSMKRLYKNQVVLCPDIVLSISKTKFNLQRNKIGICLRNDCETNMKQVDHDAIISCVKKINMPIIKIDTISNENHIDFQRRETVLIEKFKEIAQCKLFITDRLHGMIFAYLTETPCIVFSNNNKKIIGVYEWLKNISYIKFVKNINELDENISYILNHKNIDDCIKYEEFSTLIEKINEVKSNAQN